MGGRTLRVRAFQVADCGSGDRRILERIRVRPVGVPRCHAHVFVRGRMVAQTGADDPPGRGGLPGGDVGRGCRGRRRGDATGKWPDGRYSTDVRPACPSDADICRGPRVGCAPRREHDPRDVPRGPRWASTDYGAPATLGRHHYAAPDTPHRYRRRHPPALGWRIPTAAGESTARRTPHDARRRGPAHRWPR